MNSLYELELERDTLLEELDWSHRQLAEEQARRSMEKRSSEERIALLERRCRALESGAAIQTERESAARARSESSRLEAALAERSEALRLAEARITELEGELQEARAAQRLTRLWHDRFAREVADAWADLENRKPLSGDLR